MRSQCRGSLAIYIKQKMATVYVPQHHHHHHTHHLQQPPHVRGIPNKRNAILRCAQTKTGRRCLRILVPLAILSAILSWGIKFIEGPGKLGNPSSGSDYFSPFTTLVFPVSGLYCDSYSLTKYFSNPPSTLSWDTTLYILQKKPPFSERNLSIFREGKDAVVLKPGDFYQWSFFLRAGSRYEINSCVYGEGNKIELHVIQGKRKFSEWLGSDNYSDSYYHLPSCESIGDHQGLHPPRYNVTSDDKYYFVYSSPRSQDKVDQVSRVLVDMSFTKLEYSVGMSDVYQSCYCSPQSDSGLNPEYYKCQSCDLPLSFRGFVLIETVPQPEVKENSTSTSVEDEIYITWTCNSSYTAYLLLFCLPLLCISIAVLFCADLPKMCSNKSISTCCQICCLQGNEEQTESNSQNSGKCVTVLLLLLWMVVVSFFCAFVYLFIFTLCMQVVSYIAGSIPGLVSNDLKLGLLAVAAILFVLSLICNSLRRWILKKVKKVILLVRRVKMFRVSDSGAHVSTVAYTTTSKSTRAASKLLIFRLMFCNGLVTLFIAVVISASALFVFWEAFFPILTTYAPDTDTNIFIAGDSRTFTFNSFFCSEYSISSYGSPHLSAKLEIVDPKSITENYTLSSLTSDEVIHANVSSTMSWNFFLNEESSASLKACVDNEEYIDDSIEIDIVTYDAFGIHKILDPYYLDVCSFEMLSYNIKNNSQGFAGKYWLWLYTSYPNWVSVHVEIELNRYEYFTKSENVGNSQTCSISSHTQDTCTASAFNTAGTNTGLISVSWSNQSTANYSWQESLTITKTCKYHWATWTALWLPVLVINIVVFSVLIGVVYRKTYKQIMKKKEEEYVRESGNQTDMADSATEPLLPDPNTTTNSNGNDYGSCGDRDITDNHGAEGVNDTPPTAAAEQVTGEANGLGMNVKTVAILVDVEQNSNDAISSSDSVESGLEENRPLLATDSSQAQVTA